ncbi:MAG: hypothetical protein ACFCVE_15395 [Phycisphaerae bacterium]
MSLHDPAIATVADYSDAMSVARKTRTILFLLLLVVLLAQLALFFVARFTDVVLPGAPAATTEAVTAGAVQDLGSADLSEDEAVPSVADRPGNTARLLEWLSAGLVLVGLGANVLLSLTLLLILGIMLVGRLIGAGRVTSAYLLSLVLLFFMVPWQTLVSFPSDVTADFVIPGVLWTWSDLVLNARFGMDGESLEVTQLILKWTRFVAAPLAAVVLLLLVQLKSGRGLKQAFGEDGRPDPDDTVFVPA